MQVLKLDEIFWGWWWWFPNGHPGRTSRGRRGPTWVRHPCRTDRSGVGWRTKNIVGLRRQLRCFWVKERNMALEGLGFGTKLWCRFTSLVSSRRLNFHRLAVVQQSFVHIWAQLKIFLAKRKISFYYLMIWKVVVFLLPRHEQIWSYSGMYLICFSNARSCILGRRWSTRKPNQQTWQRRGVCNQAHPWKWGRMQTASRSSLLFGSSHFPKQRRQQAAKQNNFDLILNVILFKSSHTSLFSTAPKSVKRK